ncbi:unnamed protein product, partial [marine sediment metagenome]
LMDQYPDFVFVQSQAQLYEFIRQDYPNLFDAVRQKVKEGTWEVIGGMWVEADCNISGGGKPSLDNSSLAVPISGAILERKQNPLSSGFRMRLDFPGIFPN